MMPIAADCIGNKYTITHVCSIVSHETIIAIIIIVKTLMTREIDGNAKTDIK